MKRKKTDNPSIGEPANGTPVEGVIDLDPAAGPTEGLVGEVIAEQRTRRRRGTRVVKPTKPLVNAEQVHALAVDAFETFYRDEYTLDAFAARIADLKALQTIATKLATK